jgi:hypothetical protein
MGLAMNSEFKVLDSIWFSSGNSNIGIVIGETVTGKRRAFIKGVDGYSLETDIDDIAIWGTPFPLEAAYELFKHLKPNQ